MTGDIISVYNDLANRTWANMVRMVGVHTVMVLAQRALWVTGQKYPEAEAIKFDEGGISFEGLKSLGDARKAIAVVEEFHGALITILARLVGLDIAKKIAREIDPVIGRESN